MSSLAQVEIQEGKRFAFGKNWSSFLHKITADDIARAKDNFTDLVKLENDSYSGLKFIDVGCGSGIVSLVAKNLGMNVTSFDFDEDSVNCATSLKQKYFPKASDWSITPGSILDLDFLNTLGEFDIVYSWGELHHTGEMYKAFENVIKLVKPKGYLCIAIYNDQGIKSQFWKWVKRTYCSGLLGKTLMSVIFYPYFVIGSFFSDLLKLRNPISRYLETANRGMSYFSDVRDWIGGYPFEVASPEELDVYFSERGFELMQPKLCGNNLGCNELVFRKIK